MECIRGVYVCTRTRHTHTRTRTHAHTQTHLCKYYGRVLIAAAKSHKNAMNLIRPLLKGATRYYRVGRVRKTLKGGAFKGI